MGQRTDISSILLIGSGPIVIGQACEFDYSGTQGCQSAAIARLSGRPRELQPSHDHGPIPNSRTPPTSSPSRPR